MVVPFRKISTKKVAILTSKIDQLIITIGISTDIAINASFIMPIPKIADQYCWFKRTTSVLTIL